MFPILKKKLIKLAKKLLQKAPELLQARNNWGECPVFQAVRHGRRKIFKFLVQEVENVCATRKEVDYLHFFQRDDKVTILHVSILTGNFDLALVVAERYPYLCEIPDQHGTTAFQILACNPRAFKSGTELGFLKQLIYSSVSTNERADEERQSKSIVQKAFPFISGKSSCILPVVEEVREMKRGHEAVLKLTKILAQSDISWRGTHKPGAELMPVINVPVLPAYELIRMGSISSEPLQNEVKNETSQLELARSGKCYCEEEPCAEFDCEHEDCIIEIGCRTCQRSSSTISNSKVNHTPLFLAASKGCTEIVEEILDVHPQAFEYIDQDGMNLLHVAVKYRHLDVLKLLETRFHFESMIYHVDKGGNSLLHLVGVKKGEVLDAKMRSPVIVLSEDLLLLEYMKKICPSCLLYHRNNEMKTADELFAINNEKLRKEAKEWIKRTAEHCTVVTVLIATVAFAAAYTIPGGPNQQTGVPLLLGKPFFLVFTLTDVLSLGFALTAVIVFLSILTSSFQLKDFRRSLPQKLLVGFTLLFLSVSMMMVAFAATIILTIHNRQRWTKIAIYTVAFFPVSIFVLSYIPLYIRLVETFKYWVKKIGKSLPRCVARPTCFTSSNTHPGSTSSSASTHLPHAADFV